MRNTQRKLQATATINIALPLIKKDGAQATGLALNTLSTKIIKPDGTALAGYTEATFTEPGGDGVYNIQFPVGAAVPAFTLVDQGNPYTVTVDSSTADVEPTTLEVWIVSRLPHENPTLAEIMASVIEGTLTLKQILRIVLSALAGKTTGGGTNTVTYRDVADAKARITATVQAGGTRTAITLDATD